MAIIYQYKIVSVVEECVHFTAILIVNRQKQRDSASVVGVECFPFKITCLKIQKF